MSVLAPGLERALRERDVLLEWWDAPAAEPGQGLRARLALLAIRDRTAQLKAHGELALLRENDDEHERRFVASLCAAFAVARMGAAAKGVANPLGIFRLQAACGSLPEDEVTHLGIGFAVLWEQLTEPKAAAR